ncbi:Aquaporin 4 [Puccinia graminis f. sp. tritici]|uniref:Aquaporin 4 n=2 Tax=Puccinia graminis f. sp. tritici TaxID=56615 RepID=A0A5B0S6Q4_PUCGR|nr:Aquaporin 4 [Puccinia graminis f. sp. tritici]KAA1133502.1 Aquaporin 4 [Puccinia graminis f. sp. tritici]
MPHTVTVTRLKLSHLKFTREDLRRDFKNDMVAAFGEFVGTFTFMLLGLGGIQAAGTSNSATLARAATQTASETSKGASAINTVATIEQLTYISVSMGLSLLFSAWIFYRATGAAFNPNVSFALVLVGVISPTRFFFYVISQFAGAITACGLLEILLPGPLAVTPALGADTNPAQGVFIECFITCALILSVLFLAVEKHRATFLAPLGIGITLFAGHLFAVVYTGAATNTARAFGPSVITGFGNDHWVYWVGPTLGSFLAVTIYTLMKRFKYWRLNLEQDTDKGSKSPDLFFQEKIEAGTDKANNAQRLLPSLGQITDLLRGNPNNEEGHHESGPSGHPTQSIGSEIV